MTVFSRRHLVLGGAALAVAGPVFTQPPPLVFAFQPQKDPAGIKAAADRMSAALSQRLGRKVDVLIPLAYAATVQALVSRRADAAWVSSLPYLLAQRDGGAELLLAEVRTDTRGRERTDYDSVFVVPVDSPLRTFDDLKRNAKSLRMAFTSNTSTSGYVFPYARMVREGMLRKGQPPEHAFRSVSYAGGYTQALEQLLAGRADVAAVSDYTVEGPRRATYLPEERQRELRILARTPGVPTHVVAVRGGLDARTKSSIREALLAVSRSDPGLLSDVYGASSLRVVDPGRHARATVQAIEMTGLPIKGLVGA
ncbi:MAG: phosphate/phosphite/phosphonate ABC transporter substrate-binding protein [Thermaurantiacus sp.]